MSGSAPPLVSVIIPTYNRWPVVRDAIESVFAQTFADFELIVVDDGSTDSTVSELASLGPRLRLLTQPNRGVSAARNSAISHASGRYLALLDSDDLWLPKKLAIQTGFMERNRDVLICQTEEIWIRNGVRVNPKKKHQKPSGNIFVESLDLCLVSPSAVMLRRELLQEIGGFDENFQVCEDYDLWLRIAVDHSVPLIDEPLVIKRGGHADQLSRSIWGMDRYRVLALQKLLRSGISGTKRIAALEALGRKVAVLAEGARKRGKLREAEDYETILTEFTLNEDGRDGNSRLRDKQELSPADGRALA